MDFTVYFVSLLVAIIPSLFSKQDKSLGNFFYSMIRIISKVYTVCVHRELGISRYAIRRYALASRFVRRVNMYYVCSTCGTPSVSRVASYRLA